MSLNFKINDPETYLKMDKEFQIYFKELDTLLHSELYSDLRNTIDTTLETIKNGKYDSDKQMKEYIEGYKHASSAMISTPYAHIFKYLLLVQFNIVSTDLDRNDMSEFLKLKELAKHINILPIKQSGGGGDENEMVPYQVQRRGGFNWKVLLFSGLFGISGYLFTTLSVTNMNNTIVENFNQLFQEHDKKIMTLVNDKLLPSGYSQYTALFPDGPPAWFEDGLNENLRDEYKDEKSNKLLALPSKDMVHYAVSPQGDELTTDILNLIALEKIIPTEKSPFTALDVYDYERTRSLVYELIKPKQNSFEKQIEDFRTKGLISSDEVLSLVLYKELPIRLRSAFDTIGANTVTNFRSALSMVGDRVQSQTTKLVKDRLKVRVGKKTAAATESLANEGMFEMLKGLSQITFASLSGHMADVTETGTVTLTSALSKTNELSRDTYNMIKTYTEQMAMFFPDHLIGLQRDLGQDFVMLRIGFLVMLLSQFIMLYEIFGADTLVLNLFIVPMIMFLISSNPLISLLATTAVNAAANRRIRRDGGPTVEYLQEGGKRKSIRRTNRKQKTRKSTGSKHKKSKSKSSRKHKKSRRKTSHRRRR